MSSKSRKSRKGPVLAGGVEVVYEFAGDWELPPLNQEAEAILAALKTESEPLSRQRLMQKTGMAAAKSYRALALLTMHDLVRVGRGRRGCEVYWWKGWGEEQPPAKPKPRRMPAPESMPFFDLEEPVDRGTG